MSNLLIHEKNQLSYDKAPPRISSIEFEGDKSDIPLLLSVQMQVKNDIYLKLLVSHDCFEPITAQDVPTSFFQFRCRLKMRSTSNCYCHMTALSQSQPRIFLPFLIFGRKMVFWLEN